MKFVNTTAQGLFCKPKNVVTRWASAENKISAKGAGAMKNVVVIMCLVLDIAGISAFFIAPVAAKALQSDEYIMNEVCEVILTSKTLHAADVFDVHVSALFTGPGGQNYEIPGRPIGGNQWSIRFQPPTTGTWTYQTICRSHPSDQGLNGVKGSVKKDPETRQPTVFYATDYVDSHSENATPEMMTLLREASDHARHTGLPVEIQLEKKAVYRLNSYGSDNSHALTVSEVKNLVIDGNGATLVGLNIQSGILHIKNCENIVVKNLYIDYDPLPYAFGSIVYVFGSVFHFKIDEGYIEFDHPAYQLSVERNASWGVKISQRNGEIIYGQPIIGSKIFKPLGNRIWQLDGSTLSLGGGLQVNEKVVISARNYAQAIAIESTGNVVLEKITVYSSPALCFYPHLVEDFVIRDCHVQVMPGRPISSNADAIHMRGARGNIMIDGCTFEGMLDDAINIHSSPMSVLKRISNNQYELSRAFNTIRVGDRLVAIERITGTVKGILTVMTMDETRGDRHVVTFNQPIDLMTGTGFTNADNLYNLDECASAFVIKDCTFNSYRGRGLLLSSQNGLVYNNTFNILGSPSIHFYYETRFWGEGPYGKDIFIKDNVFICNAVVKPTIVSEVQSEFMTPSEAFKNIFILNNTFIGFGKTQEDVVKMNNTVPDTIIFEDNEYFDSKGEFLESQDEKKASGFWAHSDSIYKIMLIAGGVIVLLFLIGAGIYLSKRKKCTAATDEKGRLI
jgi:hypothetical protein